MEDVTSGEGIKSKRLETRVIGDATIEVDHTLHQIKISTNKSEDKSFIIANDICKMHVIYFDNMAIIGGRKATENMGVESRWYRLTSKKSLEDLLEKLNIAELW